MKSTWGTKPASRATATARSTAGTSWPQWAPREHALAPDWAPMIERPVVDPPGEQRQDLGRHVLGADLGGEGPSPAAAGRGR